VLTSSAYSCITEDSAFVTPVGLLCSTLYSEISCVYTLFQELSFLNDWLVLYKWICCYFDLELSCDGLIEIRTFKYWVNALTTTITQLDKNRSDRRKVVRPKVNKTFAKPYWWNKLIIFRLFKYIMTPLGKVWKESFNNQGGLRAVSFMKILVFSLRKF
jgi:hypothetical protein